MKTNTFLKIAAAVFIIALQAITASVDAQVKYKMTTVDVWFGPKPPPGKEANWIMTAPGKGWWVCLRLYGPLESWFDKTWKPGEIEFVKENI